MPTTKRAAIYARVSTDEQAEHGYGLPSQIEACRHYAEASGFVVVAEMQDEFSGASLDRPSFSKLRTMVRNKEIDVVVCHCADRLTRNLAHSLILRDEFERAGVERHYALRGRSENTPENRMLENIEGVFAEYEREKIKERMSRGRYQKAKSGRFVGNGKTPYGYRKNGHALEIYEPEAMVVRRIFDLYQHGRDGKRVTCRGIATMLSSEGVPPPGISGGAKFGTQRPYWSTFTIHYFLANETFSGIHRYGRNVGRGGIGGERPIEERIAVEVPAIVSRAQWELVQKLMTQNKHANTRVNAYQYLLRGFVKCSHCGYAMVGGARRDWRNKEVVRGYYRCNRNSHVHKGLEDARRCTISKYILAKSLEDLVWNYVVDTLTGEGFEAALRKAQAEEADTLQPRREALANTERLIAECEAEARALVALIGKTLSPLISSTIEEQIANLDKRHAALVIAKLEMSAELIAAATPQEDIAAAMQFRNDVLAGLQNPTFDEKRQILTLLGLQVRATREEVHIELRIPKKSHSATLVASEVTDHHLAKTDLLTATAISPLPSPPCTQTPRL